jgi:hypothetical protein
MHNHQDYVSDHLSLTETTHSREIRNLADRKVTANIDVHFVTIQAFHEFGDQLVCWMFKIGISARFSRNETL